MCSRCWFNVHIKESRCLIDRWISLKNIYFLFRQSTKETDPRGGRILGKNDCMWGLLAKRPSFALTSALDILLGTLV